jgi:hypothetical protein
MAGGKTYTPNFYIQINGHDFTKTVTSWQLDDVDDGISTLNVTLANPDGIIAGYIRTETDVTLRYGYWDGRMSQPVTMKIKDLSEKYPTNGGMTISFTAYDCTERLVGLTHAGNSAGGTKTHEGIESLLDGAGIKPEVKLESPEKLPEKLSLHNMTSHAAIRWLMGISKCKGSSGPTAGENPIAGQKEGNAGDKFKQAESVTGDRSSEGLLNASYPELDDIRVKNKKKKAGSSVITGRLEIVGHPGIEAKKCVTVLNVGSQASGKWYVKKSSQKYSEGQGYTTICDLLRASVGKDGKPVEQPIVLYAKIYQKDTAFVGCREIDAESQATFIYGQPEENSDELTISFSWSIKLQQSRGAGEAAKTKAWAANQARKVQEGDAPKDGSWNNQTQAPPPAPDDNDED